MADKRLTPAQMRGIQALLTHASITEAAQSAGISRVTLWRWMQDETFCIELKHAESELMAGVSRQLATLAAHSLSALSDALTQPNKPAVKLRAAEIVLSKYTPMKDAIEFGRRLDALEKLREALKEN